MSMCMCVCVCDHVYMKKRALKFEVWEQVKFGGGI